MLRHSRTPTLPEHRAHLHAPDRYTNRRRVIWNPFRRIPTAVKWILGLTLLCIIYYLYTWEIHVEIQFYKRAWVNQEIMTVEPLSGCFTPERIHADGGLYNVSEALYGPKRHELHAGLQMRLGMDCYDYAGTIASPMSPAGSKPSLSREQRTNFHTYWRADLEPFGDRQEWMLKSFFATQDLSSSTLILWSNGDLSHNLRIALYLKAYPESFELRKADIRDMSQGTALENSPRLKTSDAKAWVDGDLVRLLVIWRHGGVWVDMDSLLTRDLSPLLDHEFVTQWDCYDKIYQPMNGALMNFHKRSPYLCEAFHIMSTSAAPRPDSTDWGSLLYHKLWRRLIASSIPPFKVLPSCFSEGRSCRMDNRLPDPFAPDPKSWADGRSLANGGDLEDVLKKIFVVHLHNQWAKPFPAEGWVDRLLLRKYSAHLPSAPAGLVSQKQS